jgi:hypothetical protein
MENKIKLTQMFHLNQEDLVVQVVVLMVEAVFPVQQEDK